MILVCGLQAQATQEGQADQKQEGHPAGSDGTQIAITQQNSPSIDEIKKEIYRATKMETLKNVIYLGGGKALEIDPLNKSFDVFTLNDDGKAMTKVSNGTFTESMLTPESLLELAIARIINKNFLAFTLGIDMDPTNTQDNLGFEQKFALRHTFVFDRKKQSFLTEYPFFSQHPFLKNDPDDSSNPTLPKLSVLGYWDSPFPPEIIDRVDDAGAGKPIVLVKTHDNIYARWNVETGIAEPLFAMDDTKNVVAFRQGSCDPLYVYKKEESSTHFYKIKAEFKNEQKICSKGDLIATIDSTDFRIMDNDKNKIVVYKKTDQGLRIPQLLDLEKENPALEDILIEQEQRDLKANVLDVKIKDGNLIWYTEFTKREKHTSELSLKSQSQENLSIRATNKFQSIIYEKGIVRPFLNRFCAPNYLSHITIEA